MERTNYYHYIYEGPVKEFDMVLVRNWRASTYAPTKEKARSNIAYQFKRQTNRSPATKIILPGTVTRVE